jgi:hypothetical protein
VLLVAGRKGQWPMNAQTIAELLAVTDKLDDLPLGAVRALRELRPQVRELAARLDTLEEQVSGLLTTPGVAPVVEIPPVPAARLVHPEPDAVAWTLQPDDIDPGIIAWFDDNTLNTDPHVSKPRQFDGWIKQRATGGRPFICLEADDAESTWVALSAQYNEAYLKLNAAWVRPADMLKKVSYVTGNVYEGPHHSFCVAAAQTEHPKMDRQRPKLLLTGLKAVRDFCNDEVRVAR